MFHVSPQNEENKFIFLLVNVESLAQAIRFAIRDFGFLFVEEVAKLS